MNTRVRRADVAAGCELLEGFERGARTDRRILAAVHQLEQLHCELDVADTARPALHLAIRQALATQHLFRTHLHGARFTDRAGVERVGPHEPRRTPDEFTPERRGSGDRVGLDERLQFPVLRPAFPVRLEPLECATQRAGSSFGPQRGVGAEHDPVRGRPAHRRQHGACHTLGLGLIAFVHEHHVDVARVVELVPAELSHTDHCELDARCRVLDGHVETRLRQIRELAPDLTQIGDREQVPARDPHQALPLPLAQGAGRVVGAEQRPCRTRVVDLPSQFGTAQRGYGNRITFERAEQ